MEKAFSYRFYPTPEQESLLRRTLGGVRLVYNKALHERTQGWYQRQKRIGYSQTSDLLTQWKKQAYLDFLYEVSCVPLQQGLRHLKTAFSNFFNVGQNTQISRRKEMAVVLNLLSRHLSLEIDRSSGLKLLNRWIFDGRDNCQKDVNLV